MIIRKFLITSTTNLILLGCVGMEVLGSAFSLKFCENVFHLGFPLKSSENEFDRDIHCEFSEEEYNQ